MRNTALILLWAVVAHYMGAAIVHFPLDADDDERRANSSARFHDDSDEYDDAGSGTLHPDCGTAQFCGQPANYPEERMAALVLQNAEVVGRLIPSIPLSLRCELYFQCPLVPHVRFSTNINRSTSYHTPSPR
jgi:hypothetical protein